MTAHKANNARDFNKKGTSVNIRKNYKDDGKLDEKGLEVAIRSLKKIMRQEGVIRDVRRKEHYESKGTIRRRKREVAVRKQQLAEKNKEY
ncbi:MAG: 30S ribosomal protein S21 [Caudoviricetes sp.]|nr:MAG: 30S ribosomal protein S21 [Caudoviricetes sp.]